MSKRKLSIFLVYILTVVFVFIQRMGMKIGYPLNSDELSTVMWGHDIVHGDFFLKNWYGSTGTDYPVYILLGIFKSVFGYSTFPYYVLSALNYATLVFLIAFLAGIEGKMSEQKKFSFEAFLIVLCLLSIPRNLGLFNVGTLVFPQLIIVLMLFATIKLYKSNALSWKKICLLASLVGIFMGVTSSVLAIGMYYFSIPICLCAFLNLWISSGTKFKNLVLLYIGVLSLTLGVIFEKFYNAKRDGVKFGEMSTAFLTKEMFWDNIRQTLSNSVEFFGVNLWGEKLVSLATVKGAIGFLVIAFFIWYLIKNKDLFLLENYLELRLYGIVSAIALIAFSISQIPAYSASIHLMEPFFYYLVFVIGNIIAVRGLPRTTKTNLYRLLFLAFFLINIPPLSFKITPVPQKAVADYLVENGYTDGIATYWNAASTVFESKEKLNIAPTQGTIDQKLEYWKFAAKKSWLSGKVQFFIYTNTDTDALGNRQYAINTFGEPSSEKVIGKQTILFWDTEKTLEKPKE